MIYLIGFLFWLVLLGIVLRHIAFPIFAELLVRCGVRLCKWRGRVRNIARPDSDETYLVRYPLLGWIPGDPKRWWGLRWLPNIYLHNIRLPDSDPALHNHPWPWAISLILQGGYQEVRPSQYGYKYDRVAAGQFNVLKPPRDFHRINDVYEYRFSSGNTMRGEGCWTLFVTSAKHGQWGFDVPGEGFVPHRIRNPVTLRSRVAQAQTAALRELNRRQRSDADERKVIPT